MNKKIKLLLLIPAIVAFIALIMWGRYLYGPTDEASAIKYVGTILEYTAVEGELVYNKQVSAGCADEFSGWIKTGRDCQYDGDAIYVLNTDQVGKLTDVSEKIMAKKYRLTSGKPFNTETVGSMKNGTNPSISGSYYQKRGASQTLLSLDLTSGEMLNSSEAGGYLTDIKDKLGRKIEDNDYLYTINVTTWIPFSMVEKK